MTENRRFMYEGRPFIIPVAFSEDYVVRKRWVKDSRTKKVDSVDWLYHVESRRRSLGSLIWFVILTTVLLIWNRFGGLPNGLAITIFIPLGYLLLLMSKLFYSRSKELGTDLMKLIVSSSIIGYWAHGDDMRHPVRQ